MPGKDEYSVIANEARHRVHSMIGFIGCWAQIIVRMIFSFHLSVDQSVILLIKIPIFGNDHKGRNRCCLQTDPG